MSLPWSTLQLESLREMGFDVLALKSGVDMRSQPVDAALETAAYARLPAGLLKAARGIDLRPLLADGIPRDAATRRALWRALRPLRKAARSR